MTIPAGYSFSHYLDAKKSVDDRALNTHVWSRLAQCLTGFSRDRPLRILEVGAGTGTMIERMLDTGLLTHAIYTAIDSGEENRNAALKRIRDWADCNEGMRFAEFAELCEESWRLEGPGRHIKVRFYCEDFFDFASRERGKWDLIVASAFLDLVDIRATIPLMLKLLEKGSVFYFPINFDGLTIFEPAIDEEFDERIISLYHKTMDERRINGRPSGDSRAGRHLFSCLKEAGLQVLAAGASDWVVFAGQDGYHDDEAYFLHFILDTIQQALRDSAEIDSGQLHEWICRRHNQVENNELIYVAHQMDFVGIVG
jgi:SAM-dependent methyltransferase